MTHLDLNTSDTPIGKALIAYHADCIDGFTAAWVTHNALTAKGYTCHLLPMEYTAVSAVDLRRELNVIEYNKLYVVDFSLDIDLLRLIAKEHRNTVTTILDHHKTAFEKYNPSLKSLTKDYWFIGKVQDAHIHLANGYSGAAICWKFFHPSTALPNLIRYVQDYDLWRFVLGDDTKYVNKYLCSEYKTIAKWDHIAQLMDTSSGMRHILETGATLQAHHDEKVAEIAEQAVEVCISGCKGLAVACPREFTSEVGHILAKQSGTFGAMYNVSLEKASVTWSLRSEGGYDVSRLAAIYGGGGHKNAAGFVAALF